MSEKHYSVLWHLTDDDIKWLREVANLLRKRVR